MTFVLGKVASQTRYLGSPQREAYSLYVERCGRPSNEVWRRKLPQHVDRGVERSYTLRGIDLATRRTQRMAVTVKPLPDGPLQVKGECELLDAQGNAVAGKGGDLYLCRCGQSAN